MKQWDVSEQVKTVISEPVILNAMDSAFIISLLVKGDAGRNAHDAGGIDKISAIDLLTNGSKEFRE